MSRRVFGVSREGTEIGAFDLRKNGARACVIEWGAVLQDYRIAGVAHSLVLGFPNLPAYEADTEHVGAIVGRCANRLSGGRFEIDGVEGFATRNIDGRATLHGGDQGYSRRAWRAIEWSEDAVSLALVDEDGREGFPGEVRARCDYLMLNNGLEIRLSATTSSPTPINLTQHGYFNLSGAATIDDHLLEVAADRLTPLGPDLMPTGAVSALEETTDHRRARRIGAREIDVNYVLSDEPSAEPRFAASATAGGVRMTLHTTAPGLQVYSGHNMPEGPGTRPRAGFCLEPQFWPDAPNNAGFPSIIHRPGAPFEQVTRLFFEKSHRSSQGFND